MLTILNEKFYQFNENNSEVIAEIVVDTVDELPMIGEIQGKILHQGSVALITKEGKIAILSSDGNWYIGNEMVENEIENEVEE